MIRIHSKWSIFAILTFILASIVMVTAIVWTIYPYKTADIVEPVNIMNENNEIRQNETILMELKITKHNLYPVESNNAILCDNGRIYTASKMNPNGSASLPVGTYTRIQDAYSVPGDAEIGTTCHFEFQNSYKVNPIRTIFKTWVSEDFKIIEGGNR